MASGTNSCYTNFLRQYIQDGYEEEECGICKTPGADQFWFSPDSRSAHYRCIQQLERHQVEKKLNSTIETLWSDAPNKWNHMAHLKAIEAVEEKLGGRTIQYALEQDGAGKIKLLFDEFGVKAARQYYLNSQDSSDEGF